MKKLLAEVAKCKICSEFLPNAPRPILQLATTSKIIVIGQAPGRKVHESGIPWDDKSGEKLVSWFGVSLDEFHDTSLFGILPMGFCYPGTGKTGDLPPRPECAPQWHNSLLSKAPKRKLIVLIGQYAQNYYLGKMMKRNLTETVKNFEEYLPNFMPIVHPSPLNFRWHKKNPWFETELVPILKVLVKDVLNK